MFVQPKEYVSDKFESPYEKIGYINSKQEGYCKALGFDINHPLIQLPTEIGANQHQEQQIIIGVLQLGIELLVLAVIRTMVLLMACGIGI